MFTSASLSLRCSWYFIALALSACGASHHAGTKHDQNMQPSGDADSGSNPSGVDGGSVEQDAGAPGQTCAGFADIKCPAGQYCAFPPDSMCGASQGSDASGTCKDSPVVCDQQLKPVCGCDRMTYGNACIAAMHGADVLHEGACEQSGKSCGGKVGTPCQAGEFCAYEQCAVFDDLGHCEKIPEGCNDVYQPVCGCDGVTYANACEAAVAQQTVAHQEACSGNDAGPHAADAGQNGVSCGGFAGLTCEAGKYCKYQPGSYCGGDDSSGVCTQIPQACPDDLVPVCGCDGKTYGNECDAAAHGVGISHAGKC